LRFLAFLTTSVPRNPKLSPVSRRGCSATSEEEQYRRLHGLQAVLLHDPADEHRLQRVLPEDQEGAAPDARAGEPPDRPEARPGERLGRLQPAGRGHQDQEADQPARRDIGAQGGRRAGGRRRAGRRRRADALKLKPTLYAPAEHSDAACISFLT
uniref:Uncharacterized protein n=1 Tax=Triticum urartu TaxID=4572 RepID=A0A8R7UI73_TRIUA